MVLLDDYIPRNTISYFKFFEYCVPVSKCIYKICAVFLKENNILCNLTHNLQVPLLQEMDE